MFGFWGGEGSVCHTTVIPGHSDYSIQKTLSGLSPVTQHLCLAQPISIYVIVWTDKKNKSQSYSDVHVFLCECVECQIKDMVDQWLSWQTSHMWCLGMCSVCVSESVSDWFVGIVFKRITSPSISCLASHSRRCFSVFGVNCHFVFVWLCLSVVLVSLFASRLIIRLLLN